MNFILQSSLDVSNNKTFFKIFSQAITVFTQAEPGL